MTEQEPLPAVVERMRPALEFVIGALREAIPSVTRSQVEAGLDPREDPSLVNNFVRRLVRESMKARFPELAEGNSNMSPLYVTLGPFRLRIIHARNGKLPRAKSRARDEYYVSNDRPSLLFNIFPPSDLVLIPEDDTLVEDSLVLIWDSEGGQLTLVELCRPSKEEWPGESIVLLTQVVAEDDIDIRSKGRDEKRRASGDDSSGEDDVGQ